MISTAMCDARQSGACLLPRAVGDLGQPRAVEVRGARGGQPVDGGPPRSCRIDAGGCPSPEMIVWRGHVVPVQVRTMRSVRWTRHSAEQRSVESEEPSALCLVVDVKTEKGLVTSGSDPVTIDHQGAEVNNASLITLA